MSSSLFNIAKLDESNYDSWNIQVKSVLVHQELWSVTSGSETCPENAENSDSKEVLLWKAKDEKAAATIVLSIGVMQINHIKNCKSANESWNTLRDVHRPKGPIRKVTLFKRLLGMRMTDDECIQQYVCNFVSVAEKLGEIGVSLQDEFLVIMLLASLPKSFESLVVALESRDDLPKLSAVKIKLIEEGERRKCTKSEHAEGSVQAFMVRENTCPKYTAKSEQAVTRLGTANNNNQRNKRQNLKCFSCGKKGHFAAQCREKQQHNHQKGDNCNNKNGLFAAASEKILNSGVWCVDSGASSHLCCDRHMFVEFEQHEEEIMLAGDNKMLATGRGVVRLKSKMFDVTLENVLYVKGLQCNFMSVSRAVNSGYSVEFRGNAATIKNKHGGTILRANKVSDLFIFEANKNTLFFARKSLDEATKWHSRYGHLNFASIKELNDKQMVRGLNVSIPQDMVCTVCMKSKCTQKPYSNAGSRAADVLGIVHTDVCGPMRNTSIGGARYVLTFIDDKSRYVFVYFLRTKDEVLEHFKEFRLMAERQTGKKLKILRSDNGTEFVNNAFDKYLKENGIVRQLTVPYTPQQNGVAERFNRTLIDMARCMLLSSGVCESLWAEAVSTAAYLRNRSPTKALNSQTPFEAWNGYKPTVSHLRIFGSVAIALDKRQNNKLKAKGREYIFVGYSDTSKAYRLYEHETRRLIVSRDVFFVECMRSIQRNNYGLAENLDDDVQESAQLLEVVVHNSGGKNKYADTSVTTDDEMQQAASNVNSENEYESAEAPEEEEADTAESVKRGRGRPSYFRSGSRGRPKKLYNYLNIMQYEGIQIPETVQEALASKYSNEWYKAMQDEYESLLKNDTWQVSELPKGQKAVRSKWVFALKKDKNGHIERFKARLVAKGCSQTYGVNYNETFSPVVRYSTIRMIFAIAAEFGLHLHQMDVSTAYLNSELCDDVYMYQPEMFVDKRFPNNYLKLNKALYGLKQSGRQWNIKLDSILKKIGFKACASEPCVYVKHSNGHVSIIAIYVDDLLIACSNYKQMQQIKMSISNEVEVVDKGPVQHFLSMEIDRDGETGPICIGQKTHIRKLLSEYGMEDCRPIAVPLDAGHQINCDKNECQKADQTKYQSLVGSLMYLAICTRPDILHSVCKLAQRNNDPHSEHMAAAKRILRYLCATQDKQLRYYSTGKEIEGFVDADWGGDGSDRKSYTGYAFFFAGGVFAYESKKQATVALSSTEAEYMALTSAAKEAVYLKQLLKEMNLYCPKAVVVNGDNLSAMNLVKNPVYHSRSKHIDIKYHYVRDIYRGGEIELKYCCSSDMVADILTKNLAKPSHDKFCKLLGLC